MEETKAKGTFKQKLCKKISSLYAWLIIGGASAAVLVLQLILIFNS